MPSQPDDARGELLALAAEIKKIRNELGGFDYADVERHIAKLLLEVGYTRAAPVPQCDVKSVDTWIAAPKGTTSILRSQEAAKAYEGAGYTVHKLAALSRPETTVSADRKDNA